MIGERHLLACLVAHVLERLLLVDADDSSVAARDEIPAVRVEVPDQPVGDMLALYLHGHILDRAAHCCICLVDSLLDGHCGIAFLDVDQLLKSAKPPIQNTYTDLDSRIRVDNLLHARRRFLRIGTEWSRRTAFLILCRFEKPFLSTGIDTALDFSCPAEIRRTRYFHTRRHGKLRGDVRIRRVWLVHPFLSVSGRKLRHGRLLDDSGRLRLFILHCAAALWMGGRRLPDSRHDQLGLIVKVIVKADCHAIEL